MDDGRYTNNGWLQEMPDPVTKLTWDNAALMSPTFARRIGVKDGNLVKITVTETSNDQKDQPILRELVIAALIVAGACR